MILSFTDLDSFSCSQWYLYSSVRKFVIGGTDENGENWYMTNNNQFTVYENVQPRLFFTLRVDKGFIYP